LRMDIHRHDEGWQAGRGDGLRSVHVQGRKNRAQELLSKEPAAARLGETQAEDETEACAVRIQYASRRRRGSRMLWRVDRASPGRRRMRGDAGRRARAGGQPRELGRAHTFDSARLWRPRDLHALVVEVAGGMEGARRTHGVDAVSPDWRPVAWPRRTF